MSVLIQVFVSIESLLQQLPQDHESLFTLGRTFRIRELLEKIFHIRQIMPELRGARVALLGLSPFGLIQAIIAFDGYAAAMFLIPDSIELETAENLLTKAEIGFVISPGFEIKKINSIPFLKEQLPVSQWLLATSGTTGTPKIVEHRLSTLSRTLIGKSERSASYVWGLLYDPNRFAGLQVVLQALITGSRLVIPENMSFEIQLSTLLKFPVNALSATPTLWRKLLMDGRILQLPLRQLTLGGEIADQSILDALKARFPDGRIVHIYASTEVGTGFSVKDGLEGFPTLWLDNDKIKPGLKIGKEGHLLIKPSELPGGNEVYSRLTEEGYLDTQDKVQIKNNRVIFLGRASGTINVGGNKLNPEWLEAYLMQIDEIAEVHVYGKTSKITGQLVVASVVPAKNSDIKLLRQSILEKCHLELEKWQVPAIINFVEQLPLTAAGKLKRN
jgi:acyl-CoA synthetase (AMP-forming)/AMP-acid ligase II